MAKGKKKPENFGWDVIEGGLAAEKTAAFGANPLKTHRVYGSDEKDLQRNMDDFDARLEAADEESVDA